MFRTMIAAAAALAFSAPALAQDADLLVGQTWECKTVSLIGEPNTDVAMTFRENGDFDISFYLVRLVNDQNVAVQFDLHGQWSVDETTISVSAPDFEMVGAWVDGEAMSGDDADALAGNLADGFADYAGQSEIDFISDHALVLEEPETSISCWR